MSARRPFVLALLGAPAALALAQAAPPDEARSAWRYRRALELQAAPGQAYGALELPPELLARLGPELRDVRLAGADGRDVPYVVDRREPRASAETWSAVLVDTRQERRVSTAWTVDLGAPRRFARIDVDVDSHEFAKRVRVEGSDDGHDWRLLRAEAGLFEREWAGGRVRHTQVLLDAPAELRYLRLTADDTRSPPVAVTGLSVRAALALAEARWERPVPLRFTEAKDGWSHYRLEPSEPLPIEALALDAAEPAFARGVRLRELKSVNGKNEERLLGEATLYRLKLGEAELAGESLRLELGSVGTGELLLDVHDGDSPPLRGLQLTASGALTRLLFPLPAEPPSLYYGNSQTRAPLYDLGALRERLRFEPAPAAARLGSEVENPRYARPVPLAFAPGAGAPLDVTRWRQARALPVGAGDDVYTFSLAAEDLQHLLPDLADLRIVDQAERQVPYILEREAAQARVLLAIERDTARPEGARTSRYVLRTAAAGAAPALPLRSLELHVEQPFFSRPARLLPGAEEPGRRERERPLLETVLRRQAPSSGPLELALDGARRSALRLEIDEGDDQPLTLNRAEGVVRVPRVVFKAGNGVYRLLLGNDEARAPSYDLATLSRELLAWSAVSLEPGGLEPNPAYRRRAADYFRRAPPTLLLWGALLLAVVGLLYLTARVLRGTAPPAEPGG